MKNETAKFFPFRNMTKFSYMKYEKFHLQISSTIVHKNYLFLDLNVHYLLGCLRVKYFTLPVGDMNSPSYNKFTEGIDFFWQFTQTLGRAL